MSRSVDTYSEELEERPLLEDDKTEREKRSLYERMMPYLILVSSVLSMSMAAGFNFGIAGALTVAQSRRFNISLDQASWSTSLHSVFFLMINPLSAILTRLIAIRKVQLLGCIISLLGIGLCGFATEHWHVVLLFGLVAGAGLSFIRATLLGILAYHFEKQNLSMAIAAVYVGFCAGWLIVTAPASYLFTKYGFNNTMFMVAPLMLVHLLGVVFYSQDSKTIAKKDLPESVPLKDSLRKVLTDVKVWVYILSAFGRKFGQGGFFTIYPDFAIHDLGLTLTESGVGGTVYGGVAVGAVVFVTLTHALKWEYSKMISLVISATMNGVAIILISCSVGKVSFYVLIGFLGLWRGIFLGNFISFGTDLVGARNMVLIQSFEAFGNGFGGFIGPPITSYLQESVNYKFGMYVAGSALLLCGVLLAVIGVQRYLENKKAKENSISFQ